MVSPPAVQTLLELIDIESHRLRVRFPLINYLLIDEELVVHFPELSCSPAQAAIEDSIGCSGSGVLNVRLLDYAVAKA